MTDKYIIIAEIDKRVEDLSHWVGVRAEAMKRELESLRQWIIEEVE